MSGPSNAAPFPEVRTSPSGQRLAPRKAKALLQQQHALEFRATGMKYWQIAEQLGVSEVRAWRIVQRALERHMGVLAEETEHLRALEIDRLDRQRMALWANKQNPRVADTLLRISERLAKLRGLDTPIKFEGTGVALSAPVLVVNFPNDAGNANAVTNVALVAGTPAQHD